MKLSELRENPNNPSIATERELERLAGKLKRVPLGLTAMRIAYVTDDPQGGKMVISGNKRLRVLKRAYGEDADLPNEYFQDVTAMSEAERHEFIVSANVSDGQWDLDKLLDQYEMSELQELMDTNPLEEMIRHRQLLEESRKDVDKVPDVQGDSKSEVGKTYQLGKHRLLCWDSTSEDVVAKLLGDRKADLVMTDPPYNVNVQGGDRTGRDSGGLKIMNDNMSNEAFMEFLTKVYKNIQDALKEGGVFYVWCADGRPSGEFEMALREAKNLHECVQLVWVKDRPTFNMGRTDYAPRHEVCKYGWKTGAKHYFCEDLKLNTLIQDDTPEIDKLKKEEMAELLHHIYDEDIQSAVIHAKRPSASRLHPTMKPVELIKRQIINSSRIDELVVDFFLGSGTTILACDECERICYGVEFDPHYCDVIRKRYAEYIYGEGCDWESLTPPIEQEENGE